MSTAREPWYQPGRRTAGLALGGVVELAGGGTRRPPGVRGTALVGGVSSLQVGDDVVQECFGAFEDVAVSKRPEASDRRTSGAARGSPP